MLVLPLPGEESRARGLAEVCGGRVVDACFRRFPDGETYVRLDSPVEGLDVAVVCSLHGPDDRLVPLLLAAATARDLGARTVTLVAPYLGYMRQDARFRPGEGVTSRYVGQLLSGAFDRLVTVDPHLHRHGALEEVYAIPCTRLTAAPLLGAWVRANVASPVLVGPDEESLQWVAAAAGDDLPHVVFTKVRHGDDDVSIEAPDLGAFRGRTPVLVDDVLSTGRTLIGAAERLREAGFAAPVCATVHGVFSGDATEALSAAGLTRVVTTDTIPHETNGVSVTPLLAAALGAPALR